MRSNIDPTAAARTTLQMLPGRGNRQLGAKPRHEGRGRQLAIAPAGLAPGRYLNAPSGQFAERDLSLWHFLRAPVREIPIDLEQKENKSILSSQFPATKSCPVTDKYRNRPALPHLTASCYVLHLVGHGAEWSCLDAD